MLNPPASATLPTVLTPESDPDLALIQPGLWIWHAYVPSVKAELFSSALASDGGIYLVDPIQLPDPELGQLKAAGPIAGIIVTNANHQRAALEYSDTLSLPVVAHPDTLAAIKPARSKALVSLPSSAGLEVIEIDGAVAGEIALYHSSNGGTLIIGDALINFEPYGFTFLPGKYCLDQKLMRRSLKKLLSLRLERLLFAHGSPIVAGAGDRLRALLEPS